MTDQLPSSSSTGQTDTLLESLEIHNGQPMDSASGGGGILPGLGRSASPTTFNSSSFPSPSLTRSKDGSEGRSTDSSQQRGNHSGGESGFPRLLREIVPSCEGLWGFSTSIRPIAFEQILEENSLQDGDPFLDQRVHPARGLCNQNRSLRCLFSCQHSKTSSEVSAIYTPENLLSVQLPCFWAGSSPMALHEVGSGIFNGLEGKGHTTSSISGRLGSTAPEQSSMSESHCSSSFSCSEFRVSDQQGQIRPYSEATVSVLGNGLQHLGLHSGSLNRTYRETHCNTSTTSSHGKGLSATLEFHSRIHGIYGPPTTSGTPSQTSFPEGISNQVVTESSILGLHGEVIPLVQDLDRNLDEPKLYSCPSSHSSTSSNDDSLLRRVNRGVGSPLRGSDSIRSMVCGSEEMAHKSSRVRGSSSGAETISSNSHWPICSCGHGQYHCGLLPEKTRWGTFNKSVQTDRRSSSPLSRKQHHLVSKARSGKIKRSGGCSQPVQPSNTNRMDPVTQSATTSLVSLPPTNAGSVRHSIFQTTSNICEPSSRPESVCNRRTLSELVRADSICIPSNPDPSQGNQKSKVRVTLSATDRPKVASTTMVPRTSGVIIHRSSSTKTPGRRSSSTKIGNPTQKPKHSKTSRVALLQEHLQTLGASDNVVQSVKHSIRKGSSTVYDAHWAKWNVWCSQHSINPLAPSPIQFANFLAFLAYDKNLCTSTIRTVRSAVSSTLKQLGGPDLSEVVLIRDLLRGLALKDHKSPRRTPSWDLFLVLSSLRSAPFEPLRSIDLKFLTWKTAFLITLASGRRSSEVSNLSGLDSEVVWEKDGSVSLHFLPEFLAKNQTPGDPNPVVSIKPLSSILCPDDEDHCLCPVRSLKRYRKFTRTLRSPSQRKLFISMNPSYSKDLSKASVARWLRMVIVRAYSSTPSDSLLSPRAHETRAWSTSLAFKETHKLEDILKAAYWRSRNSFISHYLRDIQARSDDGASRLPCVAAGQVIA